MVEAEGPLEINTSSEPTEYQRRITTVYLRSKEEVVQFASEMVTAFAHDCALTITITPAKSGAFYARSVIDTLSGAIERTKPIGSDAPQITSSEELAGSSPKTVPAENAVADGPNFFVGDDV